MAKTPKQKAVSALETISRKLSMDIYGDPEVAASVPIEDVESDLREIAEEKPAPRNS